jgi:hypothetical protein
LKGEAMTEEDKQLISKYMGWSENPYWWCEKCKEEKSPHHVTYVERCSDCGCPVIVKEDYSFDLNDAALCVQEMQKRGDWSNFFVWQRFDTEPLEQFIYHIAWLFNAENFFEALVQWLREGK